MTKITYPTLMRSDDGYSALLRGHNLSPETLAEAEVAIIGTPGDDWFTATEEVFFRYVPRIKNCSDLDGWGCDSEGEWHGHWIDVQPNDNPDTHFTVIRHTDVDPAETAAEAAAAASLVGAL